MATEAPASGGWHVPAHNWGWFMLRGILALLLGIGAIAFPLSAVFAFTMVFAAYCLVDGIASLIAGSRGAHQPGHRWGAMIFNGVIGILIGFLFLIMPMIATFTYAFLAVVMLAAWSIITGILEIAAAIRLRREMEGEWLLGISGAISLILGIAIIALVIPNSAATILTAAWLIAIFAFASGIILIAQSLRLRSRAAAVERHR
jgi:uncharacterized membrane protein HdeD (DUF308 family)